MDKPKGKSALKVNEGIEQPSPINREALDKIRGSRPGIPGVQQLVEGVVTFDRSIFSRAITLLESSRHDHQQTAQQVIEQCLPHSGRSIRIGITGVPGVGKSTFIEALGTYLTSRGHRVAVLAIDPSSQRSKGSILGDKTRMESLATDPNAFIRPSPSAGELGGVARKTRETIILCEAAGFDVIIVETVGVGQSETTVHSMVDFFLLLMLAGAGDELQGIKRGIMELCDALIINKADGDNKKWAELAKREYENALHLFPPAPSGWTPMVSTCSALNSEGIESVWKMIEDYRAFSQGSGYFQLNRQRQQKLRFSEAVQDILRNRFMKAPGTQRSFHELEKAVEEGRLSPFAAAETFVAGATGEGKG